jgi:hypothetical protein
MWTKKRNNKNQISINPLPMKDEIHSYSIFEMVHCLNEKQCSNFNDIMYKKQMNPNE